MQLRSLSIRNFRGLKDISLTARPETKALVIAGPNAIGKSTMLEAFRLLKSVLAPTFFSERQDTLKDMGCMAAGQLNVDYGGICRNLDAETKIEASFDLSQKEIDSLAGIERDWAIRRVGDSLGLAPEEAQMRLVNHLSTQDGRGHLQREQERLRTELEGLRHNKTIRVSLIINPVLREVRGGHQFSQDVLWALDVINGGHRGLFNYFPADRSMPAGDVNIQLGASEYGHQVKSYLAQPSVKYQRMKQFIISRFLMGPEAREQLAGDFKSVFSNLLQGKELAHIRVTEKGRVQIVISESDGGLMYDIDRMSSGEKGLLLTTVLMMRTTAIGGIVLFDEPELHLNSAVCQALVPYLLDHVAPVFSGQMVMCTHSQEILVAANHREDCELFHLRSADNICKIEPHDTEEIADALSALGASSTDILFTRGTVFVEGKDDESVLVAGFPEKLLGFKVSELGGRGGIERTIKSLQDRERERPLETRYGFIFDLDRKPTSLSSSVSVRVEQWSRYCLENYLLDPDAIYDVLREVRRGNDVELNRGYVIRLIKGFAMGQIDGVAIRMAYASREPDNPGFRPSEFSDASNFEAMAGLLAERLSAIRDSLSGFVKENWIAEIVSEAEGHRRRLQEDWDSNWKVRCNGKEVLNAVHEHYQVRLPRQQFKVNVVKELKSRGSEEWALINGVLDRVLK